MYLKEKKNANLLAYYIGKRKLATCVFKCEREKN